MKQEITVVACANAMPSQPYLIRGFNAFKRSSIFGAEESWFDVDELYNEKTQEYPAVWHFNGPAKSSPLFDKILTKLGY